ncbi:MAG: hypothetical protein GKR91_15435 [Pseudomonadales bacterium]|nr:hypothetical protein [Pseudomonadales bacterium]
MLRNVRRPRNHVPPNYEGANAVRDKLLKEITDLQTKLDNLSGSPSQNNLSAAQSFKEMIYSREELLNNLDKQKDECASFGVERKLQ